MIADAEHIVEEIALLKTRGSGATRRRLTLYRVTASLTHPLTPPNPAGFEPRIPHVSNQRTYALAYSNSAPVSSLAFPHITCELLTPDRDGRVLAPDGPA